MTRLLAISRLQVPGLVFHVAAPTEHGWFLMEVWESAQSAQAFAQVLIPLLTKAGISTDAPPTVAPLHNTLIAPLPDRNKAVVKRHYTELWLKGDLPVAEEIYSADCVGHAGGRQITGYPACEQETVVGERKGVPDMHITIDDQIAEDDRVVTRWSARGTHTGNLLGIPPTGRSLETTGMHIHRLRDGKIVEVWSQGDLLGLMQQLGVIPMPESALR